MPQPQSSQKMETGRKLVPLKKRPLAALHESKKVVSDDAKHTRCLKKKGASASDYSGLIGSKSPAMARAEEIQANLPPENPSMIKLMLPSHVSGGFSLGLPKRFCDSHMPSEDTEIILEDESGKEFKTKYLAAKAGLSAGWVGFSVLHNLIVGDVVVFQLVKPTKFKVYIVRSKRLNEVDRALSLLNVKASATHEKYLEPLPLDSPQEMVLDTQEYESDDLGSEVTESIRFSESNIDFQQVKSLDNFTVSVDGLIIDSELSKHVRTKYYELCCSQKSFLHDCLLEGLNCKLAAGIISETVSIADAIKACKTSTLQENFAIWDKTLKAFEDMGMNVEFLRAKLEKLLCIGSEWKRCREAAEERVIQADKEMRFVQDKLLQIREATKRLDAEIEALTLTVDSHDIMFQQEVDAPW